MKLDTPDFHALFTPELKYLSSLFTTNGFELRLAGGAVRDLLMGVSPADVDFATDATPTQMKELFTREQVRMFNKKGEEHGTITCRINDIQNFEITTLRIDTVCDGRRAAVEFTKDWKIDAFRRDLTINSLFLGLDGVVHDFTGGLEDLRERRIVFVGDPVRRLQEDYLRILRYFRFFGRFAPLNYPHEEENVQAIVQCRDGLKGISGERLWMELQKIVVGRMAARVVRDMLVLCGLGPHLALKADRIDEFARLAQLPGNAPNGEDGPLAVEPATALSALFSSSQEAAHFQTRCKCSNAERTLCELIVRERERAQRSRGDADYFKHLVLDKVFERGNEIEEMTKRQCIELLKYIGADEPIREEIGRWSVDRCPVGGLDLINKGIPPGPRFRQILQHVFNLWKASELKMSKEELLAHTNDPEIDQVELKTDKTKKQRPKRKHSVEDPMGTRH